LTFFSGAIIDRTDRWLLFRRLLFLSIFPPLFLSLTYYIFGFNLYLLLFFALLSQLLSSLDLPLRQVCISSIVPPSQLTQALSLQAFSFHTSRLFGSSIGGYILSLAGPSLSFLLNAISYVPFILFTGRIAPLRKGFASPEERSLKRDFAELKEFLLKERLVLFLILQVAFFSFLGVSFPVVLPKLAVEFFSGGAVDYGLFSGGIGFGAMLGALSLSLTRLDHAGELRHVYLTQILFCLSLILLATSKLREHALLSLFIMGFSFTNFFPIINSVLQRLTPDNLKGRVMSLFTLAFTGTVPFGQVFSGLLADLFGIKALCFLMSLGIIILSTVFRIKMKAQFRRRW